MIDKIKLKRYADKGYQVAFAKKDNARKYQAMLRNRGYNTGTLRSWGPTVDSKKTRVKSYYVISKKIKKKKFNPYHIPKRYGNIGRII